MGYGRDDDIPAVIERLRPLAVTYKEGLLGRHTIIEFNGMALDIHWQKHHFMHLCGLECTVPQRLYRRKNKPVRSEVFFDALLSGKTKGLNIRHSHNRGITNDKLSVLPMMLLMPESVKYIAESASSDYRYFLGTSQWCIGVTLADEPPLDPDADVYAPRTVRNVSITSRSIQQVGTVLHPLTGSRTITPK
ncbi:hypothetical protein BTIS_0046 [Bifidobacterium tissieri]|uniref:Phage-Barnase-EndoU-ColicinE5/D-RelE like nuclease 4 domain-containing protein n=1 Tax=Bifidobacterium tissieri TaxID=1630162 RepID=A0A261FJW0_9BIFI|nr:PBECR4 domain-containing protein [Bifidobacterium tissieri]OZG59315.1 hypothetical protein BTIS_0046 [Bifidobacterium tissieri]